MNVGEHEIDLQTTQEEVESFTNEDDSSAEIMEFSSDAALWDIPSKITSLQKYWISKGRLELRL